MTWKTPVLLAASLLLAVAAQARPQIANGAPTLSTADYVEIQQLYARYNHYIDGGESEKYANLFTPDGSLETPASMFGTVQGHAALARLVGGLGKPAAIQPNHLTYNVMVDPSAEGAVGAAYFMMVTAGEEGEPPTLGLRAVYHDVLVKTAEGWRFKRRVFSLAPPATPRK